MRANCFSFVQCGVFFFSWSSVSKVPFFEWSTMRRLRFRFIFAFLKTSLLSLSSLFFSGSSRFFYRYSNVCAMRYIMFLLSHLRYILNRIKSNPFLRGILDFLDSRTCSGSGAAIACKLAGIFGHKIAMSYNDESKWGQKKEKEKWSSDNVKKIKLKYLRHS